MEDNRFASVGAIVLRDNEVLLVRHTYGRAAGKLLNPSGFIKHGEMPYEALKREINEETGIEINIQGLISVRCSVNNWWLIFLADYMSGEPRSDKTENNEVLFMPSEQALSHPDVTGATKILIKLAKEQRVLIPNAEYAEWIEQILPDGQMMFS